MGACYSKNRTGSSLTPTGKAPQLKKQSSWRGKKREPSEIPNRSSSSLRNNTLLDKRIRVSVVDASQNSSSQALEEGLAETKRQSESREKADYRPLQARVAPSDSGIESIGVAQEDTNEHKTHFQDEFVDLEPGFNNEVSTSANVTKRDSTILDNGNDCLSKRLERFSRGSCHKCGNFMLDDSALTALLTDTYCLCGPRRAGQSSVNPQCRTHGYRHHQSNILADINSEGQKAGAGTNSTCLAGQWEAPTKDISHSLKENTQKELEGEPKVKVSIKSEKEAFVFHTESPEINVDDMVKDEIFNHEVLMDQISSNKESEDLTLPSIHKRKSLLSEIFDITDSICRCDFYSNEIFWAPDESQQASDKWDVEKPSSSCSGSSMLVDGSSSSEGDLAGGLGSCYHQVGESVPLATDRQLRAPSYNSLQELVESSREVSVPSARRMLIDGLDSVVIPTEVYCQMEADLNTMKQQLQCLSSLIVEEQEDDLLCEQIAAEESFM